MRLRPLSGFAAAAALLLVGVLASPLDAQQTNTQERTFLTFSSPVELPGVTLPAGTYVFRLADTPSRNVVQVLNEKETDILGQWLFVQAERPKVSDETVVMFRETREGATPAVQYWYFPGERIGKEFVYPEDQAKQIAARTGGNVLSAEGEIGPTATVFSVDARGNRIARAPAAPGQQRRESAASGPPAVNRPVTLAGCVYQVSDQPTLFALRRMDRAATSAASPGQVGSAGRTTASAAGTTGTAGADTAGAWYRLGATGERNLARYVGQHVEVTAELMPGRDERGADVVIHRVQPDRITVTTVDLQPAPQLSIQSISPTGAACDMPAGGR